MICLLNSWRFESQLIYILYKIIIKNVYCSETDIGVLAMFVKHMRGEWPE